MYRSGLSYGRPAQTILAACELRKLVSLCLDMRVSDASDAPDGDIVKSTACPYARVTIS